MELLHEDVAKEPHRDVVLATFDAQSVGKLFLRTFLNLSFPSEKRGLRAVGTGPSGLETSFRHEACSTGSQ